MCLPQTLLTERVDAISNDGFWKGYNSLHLAARGGYLQLVGVLLANGNIFSFWGHTWWIESDSQ